MLARNGQLSVFVYREGERVRALKGFLLSENEIFYEIERPLGQRVMLRKTLVDRIDEWQESPSLGGDG